MLDLERVHQVLVDEPVRFRNILAHEYTKIDRGIVYQTLHTHVSDLEQFAEQIIALLKP